MIFKMQRGFYLTGPAELTWRVGPARMRHGTQGHVAEPREPTRRLCGAEVVRTRGKATRVHADAQVAPHGERVIGLAGEGPRVSGPWLDSWGGNARALFYPMLYTQVFCLFLPCGTLF